MTITIKTLACTCVAAFALAGVAGAAYAKVGGPPTLLSVNGRVSNQIPQQFQLKTGNSQLTGATFGQNSEGQFNYPTSLTAQSEPTWNAAQMEPTNKGTPVSGYFEYIINSPGTTYDGYGCSISYHIDSGGQLAITATQVNPSIDPIDPIECNITGSHGTGGGPNNPAQVDLNIICTQGSNCGS